MSAPVPHIGQTMQQKRALAHYVPMAEQARRDRELAEHEQRRADEIHAALQVDEALARIRRAGTGECDHGVSDVPVPVSIAVQNLVIAIGAGVALGVLIADAMGYPL